jgi:hypothetical protein
MANNNPANGAEPDKRVGGRPTKYLRVFAEQAKKLCLLGATDADLADFFDVQESTINEWKKRRREFSESIRAGKLLADAAVAQSLYHRATGYEHEDVDIKAWQGDVIITPIIKRYPPDTKAAIYWLNNRRKHQWRSHQEITGKNDEPLAGGWADIVAMAQKVAADDDGGTDAPTS